MPKFSYSVTQLFRHSLKWLGGGIGWLVGGPLFGVLGFIAGTVIDSFFIKKEDKQSIGVFSDSLLIIIAAVMKAEAPVTDSKLSFVRQFLTKNYGDEILANEALKHLNLFYKQNIQLNEACLRVRNNLNYTSRLQFVQFLYKLAKLDGKLSESGQTVLNNISGGIGVTIGYQQQYTRQPFVQNSSISAAYKVLGVSSVANITEIKKAYRKLAFMYHPDKVAHVGELQKKFATEKFIQLTNAYEIIKREKGFEN